MWGYYAYKIKLTLYKGKSKKLSGEGKNSAVVNLIKTKLRVKVTQT